MMKKFSKNSNRRTVTSAAIKSMMTSIVLFSSFANTAIAGIDSTSQSQIDKVYTSKGYPYKNLLNRSEQVKIFYRQDDRNIHCRVEVAVGNTIVKSVASKVNQQSFEDTPLSSCLSRDQAKQILASTF